MFSFIEYMYKATSAHAQLRINKPQDWSIIIMILLNSTFGFIFGLRQTCTTLVIYMYMYICSQINPTSLSIVTEQ